MFKIGQILTTENYTQGALWCNAHGAHIEEQNGAYVIMENALLPEPTAEERVAALEAETGLTRVMREMVLAEGSGASDYVKAKAREIEALAAPLRESGDTEKLSATEEGV